LRYNVFLSTGNNALCYLIKNHTEEKLIPYHILKEGGNPAFFLLLISSVQKQINSKQMYLNEN